MERLWEHIEHLAPGLVLAILAFFGFGDTIAKAFWIPSNMPRDALLVGGAFVAFGYLVGVVNSSLARLLFVDVLPFVDWLRWQHLTRAAQNNDALAGAIADVRWRKDFATVQEHVAAGSRVPWRRDSRWSRKRAVFNSLSGRAQALGGAVAAELAQRRREARLMRATLFPAGAAGAYFASKSVSAGAEAAVIAALLTAVAYFSREVSVIQTFESYAEVIYNKKFQPLDR